MQRVTAVATLQQRTVIGTLGTCELMVDARMQIDHEAARREQFARFHIDHRATAGGEHKIGTQCEIGDRGVLALAETGLAFLLENERDVDAGARLDFVIAVDEVHATGFGKPAADRGLAGAHRADEVDVAFGAHEDEPLDIKNQCRLGNRH